ncbi:unnamed protein product [Calypogeia fissa]
MSGLVALRRRDQERIVSMVGGATASHNATATCLVVWDRLVGLGDKWSRQNEEWKRDKQRLEDYGNELKTWEKGAGRERGLLSSDPELHEPLSKATDILSGAIQKYEAEEDAKWTAKIWRHSVSHDRRYVHFEETEKKIYEVLNDDNGPRVVLLYGGAGKGKSTVAGNVAATYNQEQKEQNPTFECVVVHDCSGEAPIHFTQLLQQLIERLGETPTAEATVEESSQSIHLERKLKSFLERRKMLLILDDLTDKDFLRMMVQMGIWGLRILITAQQLSVCKNLDPNSQYVSFKIQGIDNDTARKILAAHSGFSNHKFPNKLLSYVDALIANTDNQPLALATLGGIIDKDRRETVEEWTRLLGDISRSLKSDTIPCSLFAVDYPRSLWHTLRLVITTKLREGARNLLLLAHAFSEPVVPEAVIWLLFNRVQGDKETFSDLRKELDDRQFVTIVEDQFSIKPKRTWHVDSLQKLYIENEVEMRRARDSVLDSLIDAGATVRQPEDDVLLHLVALYLKEDLAKKAAAKIGSDDSYTYRTVLRKKLWVRVLALARPLTARWTQYDRANAMQAMNKNWPFVAFSIALQRFSR